MKPLVAAKDSVVQYFKGAYQEFRRVSWLSRQMIIQYTIIVIITIVVCALILTAFDYGLQQLVNKFLLR